MAPPPSLGKWKWLSRQRCRASFRFQRLDAGGAFEELTHVSREIQLTANGKSFTGVVATELYRQGDTLFASGCGQQFAKRLY